MPADPLGPVEQPAAFRPPTPLVIGLLGGIAAGKSAVADLFAAHELVIVDADRLARVISEEPAALQEIAAAFGPGLVIGGRLDRAAMADLVFADPTNKRRLEAILHPRIRTRILAELDAARAAGRSVLLDAPLLLEGGLIDYCDRVVFVAADETTRRRRAAGRGWDDRELARREAAQAPLAEKMARADRTIHNDGDLPETARQVAAYLAELQAR